MDNNKKFFDAFRALDTELKSEGQTVLDYENSLESTDQEKLKVCRIMRNYMAHNDTTFLAATNDQIKFLDDLAYKIRIKSHTVKDEMKRVSLVKYNSHILDLLPSLRKYSVVPVETKTGEIYLMDKDEVLNQIATTGSVKKIVIPNKLPKYKTIAKDERIESANTGTYVVTSDGTLTGKYLGILIIP